MIGQYLGIVEHLAGSEVGAYRGQYDEQSGLVVRLLTNHMTVLTNHLPGWQDLVLE